jgi:hypothetical protein
MGLTPRRPRRLRQLSFGATVSIGRRGNRHVELALGYFSLGNYPAFFGGLRSRVWKHRYSRQQRRFEHSQSIDEVRDEVWNRILELNLSAAIPFAPIGPCHEKSDGGGHHQHFFDHGPGL